MPFVKKLVGLPLGVGGDAEVPSSSGHGMLPLAVEATAMRDDVHIRRRAAARVDPELVADTTVTPVLLVLQIELARMKLSSITSAITSATKSGAYFYPAVFTTLGSATCVTA